MFSFKLAGNFYSGGYPLPPAHINHAFGQALGWNTEGRRGVKKKKKSAWISLQDADKMAASVHQLACLPD